VASSKASPGLAFGGSAAGAGDGRRESMDLVWESGRSHCSTLASLPLSGAGSSRRLSWREKRQGRREVSQLWRFVSSRSPPPPLASPLVLVSTLSHLSSISRSPPCCCCLSHLKALRHLHLPSLSILTSHSEVGTPARTKFRPCSQAHNQPVSVIHQPLIHQPFATPLYLLFDSDLRATDRRI
jgi:hypothetical protein